MTRSATLSTTARALLTAASARDDRLALAPERLPAAARRAVVQSLLKTGLLQEIAAKDDQPAWRTTDGGERLALRITGSGLPAIGAEAAEAAHGGPQDAHATMGAPHAPTAPHAAQDAPVGCGRANTRLTLRAAAQVV